MAGGRRLCTEHTSSARTAGKRYFRKVTCVCAFPLNILRAQCASTCRILAHQIGLEISSRGEQIVGTNSDLNDMIDHFRFDRLLDDLVSLTVTWMSDIYVFPQAAHFPKSGILLITCSLHRPYTPS